MISILGTSYTFLLQNKNKIFILYVYFKFASLWTFNKILKYFCNNFLVIMFKVELRAELNRLSKATFTKYLEN